MAIEHLLEPDTIRSCQGMSHLISVEALDSLVEDQVALGEGPLIIRLEVSVVTISYELCGL